tara:strand:+ start:4368 stop:4652 length:285 start_codon:yes stop_codon:yes gene_type:complete
MKVHRISSDPSSPYVNTVAKYAWPGGYPLFYLDMKNNVLCPTCAAEEEENAKDPDHDEGYRIEACGINYEDPSLHCDECGERIESAYADEEGAA